MTDTGDNRAALLAREAWEHETLPSLKTRRLSSGQSVEEPFRIYRESAAAVIHWNGRFADIIRVETLAPKTGAATEMMKFIISLALEHGVILRGNPVPYPPSFQQAATAPMGQARLIQWYERLGFEVWESKGMYFMGYPTREAASS